MLLQSCCFIFSEYNTDTDDDLAKPSTSRVDVVKRAPTGSDDDLVLDGVEEISPVASTSKTR